MAAKTRKRRNVKKQTRKKCPAYAQLPETAMYLRTAKSFTKTHKKNKTKKKQYNFPKNEQSGEKAFLKIRKDLIGDHSPLRNMITFVTVKGDKYMDKIMHDMRNVNFIDTEVYYKVKKMEQEMVRMMGDLFNDPDHSNTKGISTIGSSEAIYVSSILHKFKWEERTKKRAPAQLNAIYSFNTHVNWDKATRWNYIKGQKVLPLPNQPGTYVFGAKEVKDRINKFTTCVICTLGTTRTGQNDKIREINDFLVEYHKKTGVFVPIHIDAAIGGFITPFLKPELMWDFRLPHVKSANVSFHKFGGTYAGMGMCVVKSDYTLPNKFRFSFNVEKTAASLDKGMKQTKSANFLADPHTHESHALTKIDKDTMRREGIGGDFDGAMDDWYINFSKPASQIVSAYYLFNKLGFEGYKKRMEKCLISAKYVSKYINSIMSIKNPGQQVFTQVNEPYYPEIAFKIEDTEFPLQEVLSTLQDRNGWTVPAYNMDPSVPDIVMRFVIKPNLTLSEAKTFVKELRKIVEELHR
jgi:glutamate decarboxylase